MRAAALCIIAATLAAMATAPLMAREAPAGAAGGSGDAVLFGLQGSVSIRHVWYPCGGGHCESVHWRPNVNAYSLAPGTYRAATRLAGTTVENACAFTAPLERGCANVGSHGDGAVLISHPPPGRENGAVCRDYVAVLTLAGAEVARREGTACT